MANIETLRRNLERRGFATSFFRTPQEAVDYLDGRLDGTVIGFGGSVTVRDMGLYERLKTHNTVLWHQLGDDIRQTRSAEVYISSANGVAETGELINIDGTGNRVSATLYGPKAVYFIIGINKIAPDFDSALWRARTYRRSEKRAAAEPEHTPAPPRPTNATTATAPTASAGR
jgi:L-lactate utilization protein LutB